MTIGTAQPAPMTRRTRRDSERRRWSVGNTVIALTVLAGVATVLYPTAADWFSDRAHATEVSGYVSDTASATGGELRSMLDAARDYNDALPNGPLRDPYTLNGDGTADSIEDGRDTYLSKLSFRKDSPMARVRIPEIHVDLPIYHGTSEKSLDRGVGHLYGSDLPVGGSGTHAVLTGHSGIPSATLFTHLDELEEGDTFYIDVAGETLEYEVDRITVVEPNSVDELRQVQDHDYVTLLTCTPTGVNTHRLLVRGERVETSAADTVQSVGANSTDPGFPWWAIGLAGALGMSVFIAWPRRSTPRPSAAEHGPVAPRTRRARRDGDSDGRPSSDRP